jgi:hypothetical protein
MDDVHMNLEVNITIEREQVMETAQPLQAIEFVLEGLRDRISLNND